MKNQNQLKCRLRAIGRRIAKNTLASLMTAIFAVGAIAFAAVLANPTALTSGSVLSADNWNKVVAKVLQIGDVGTSGKVCTSDGSKINCASDEATGGLGGYIRISENGNSRTPITLTCPAGYKVVGGGFSTATNNYANESYAVSDTQWRCATYDLGCSVWSDCRTYDSICYAVCIR